MNNKREHITELLKKYRAGTCNEHELAMLTAYIKEDRGLRHLLKDLKANFDESIADSPALDIEISLRMRERIENELKGSQENPQQPRLQWWRWAAAAMAILALGLWATSYYKSEPSLKWHTVTTVSGQQKRLVLPDSSVVFLNGDSEISFLEKMNDRQRITKLKGEAFFEVQPDADRPFFVIGPKFSIRVVGTSFNVDTKLEEAVTVKQGMVQVMTIDESTVSKRINDLPSSWNSWVANNEQTKLVKHNTPDIALEKLLLLGAQEKGGLIDNDYFKKEKNVTINNWMYKDLSFYDQPIELIINQLERYYGQPLEISPEMAGCKVTIAAKNRTLDQVLNTLSAVSNGEIITQDNIRRLVGKGCQ